MSGRRLTLALVALIPLASCQELPTTWPHDYPNKPSGDFSPAWQNYFRVNQPLPGVNFPLSRNFAGNLPVGRAGHPNNTFFWWGVEKSHGSLTRPAFPFDNEPWTIWLNGGPGSSSMHGFFFENGPMRINGDGQITNNPHSWDKLSDIFWIDQPVGVGFSTADSNGYVPDEDQVARDFMGFLTNLVKVFPSLKNRPLILAGQSYAGMYIPYILKEYFGRVNPPVKIKSMFVGDGTIADGVVFNLVPSLSVVETFPQLIGYDPEVYLYMKEQSELCGYNIELSYPQTTPLPVLPLVQPRDRQIPWMMSSGSMSRSQFAAALSKRHAESEAAGLHKRDRVAQKDAWKRSLEGRVNGTIDPWYGCFLIDMVIDYAVNYTYPWNQNGGNFDIYNVVNALSPQVTANAAPFMNNPLTRAAIHAPTSKDWASSFWYTFGNAERDPSPWPASFLDELAANATAKNVEIILVAGNNDGMIAHEGTEIAIQNTTFGGIKGFTRKPSTRWTDDLGQFAGIVHQERGWKYALFYGAGHMIPTNAPRAAYKFFRDWVLGNSPIGKVVRLPGGITTVIGGSDPALRGKNLPGSLDIYMGAGATQSTYRFPEATRVAWDAFIATETAVP